MKDGVHIPAMVVRMLVLAMLAVTGLFVVRELPGMRRYLKSEMM